jgi:hypothetical protein
VIASVTVGVGQGPIGRPLFVVGLLSSVIGL